MDWNLSLIWLYLSHKSYWIVQHYFQISLQEFGTDCIGLFFLGACYFDIFCGTWSNNISMHFLYSIVFCHWQHWIVVPLVNPTIFNPPLYIVITTRRYSPLRGLTSSSFGGLWRRDEAFFVLRANKKAFYAVFTYFRPFFVLSSNLSNFK